MHFLSMTAHSGNVSRRCSGPPALHVFDKCFVWRKTFMNRPKVIYVGIVQTNTRPLRKILQI